MRSTKTFSHEVRAELATIWPDRLCCIRAELAGLLGAEGIQCSGECYVTLGNPAVTRKAYRLLKAVGIEARIQIGPGYRHPAKKAYRVRWGSETTPDEDQFIQELLSDASKKRCCMRSFLRGAFICRGSVSSPEKQYHLEIVIDDRHFADRLRETFKSVGLASRIVKRRGSDVIYLKEAEEIVEALNIMGAHGALLKLENLRIVKDMRNRVNRLVNSETANVQKTVDAAVTQIEAIEMIDKEMGLIHLPESLRTVARLRLENPYANFRELGEMMEPKLSKSGISYRMKKLATYAERLSDKQSISEGTGGHKWNGTE